MHTTRSSRTNNSLIDASSSLKPLPKPSHPRRFNYELLQKKAHVIPPFSLQSHDIPLLEKRETVGKIKKEGFRLAFSNSVLSLIVVICACVDSELQLQRESSELLAAALRIAVVLMSLVQILLCFRYAQLQLKRRVLMGERHPCSNHQTGSLVYERGAMLRLAVEVGLLSVVMMPLSEAGCTVTYFGQKYEISVQRIVTGVIILRVYHVFKFLYFQSPYHSHTAHFFMSLHSIKHRSFIVLAQMAERPFSTLLVVFLIVVISAGFLVDVLEQTASNGLLLYDGPWLVAITQLTVGYGDLTPTTDMGRFVVIGPGLLGVLTLSIVVAKSMSKLALDKAQKTVTEKLYNQWYTKKHLRQLVCVYIQRKWRLLRARRKNLPNRFPLFLNFLIIRYKFQAKFRKSLVETLELTEEMYRFEANVRKSIAEEKKRLCYVKVCRMKSDMLSTRAVSITSRLLMLKQSVLRGVNKALGQSRRRSSRITRRHSSHRSTIASKKESDLAFKKMIHLQARGSTLKSLRSDVTDPL